jgi:hypothetical protein
VLNNLRSFLSGLSVPVEQKRYTMNFFKKTAYLNELHELAIKDTGEHINVGYGNVNSKICFVFKNPESYNTIKPLIDNILEKFEVNSWDVYITFVDKTKNEYDKKYSFLVNEIHAVGSQLLYVFDKDNTTYLDIIRAFVEHNIDFPETHKGIELEYLASTDIEVRKLLWHDFKYLINYKEIN